MTNRWGNSGNSDRLYFGRLQNHCRWWLQPWNWKTLTPWKESYDQPRQHIKKQRHYFVNKGLPSQGYGFSSGHVCMWHLGYKESWVPNNWWFWTVVLERTLESPFDCKDIQTAHPKGDQSWVFIGRTDAEAETPILWPPDAKSWVTGKDPDAGRDWRQEEKGTTGRDGWMASLTQWMWVWVNSGSWWWTGRPGALQSVGVTKSRTDWVTELTGLFSPWNSPGQNTGAGSRFLLQRIFPTQGLNPALPLCRRILYQLSHQGSPGLPRIPWIEESQNPVQLLPRSLYRLPHSFPQLRRFTIYILDHTLDLACSPLSFHLTFTELTHNHITSPQDPTPYSLSHLFIPAATAVLIIATNSKWHLPVSLNYLHTKPCSSQPLGWIAQINWSCKTLPSILSVLPCGHQDEF